MIPSTDWAETTWRYRISPPPAKSHLSCPLIYGLFLYSLSMDPVTAIGLASSIISFVTFSWSLVTGAQELYQSGEKTSKANASRRTIIEDLRDYSDDLESGTGSELTGSRHENALRRLAKDCNALSDELVKILEKLEKSKNSRWESLKTILKEKIKEEEIAGIEFRLSQFRSEVNTRLLAVLKYVSGSSFRRADSTSS
jgi:hypothetical protein